MSTITLLTWREWGEPLLLDFVIQNDSQQIITADLGQNRKGGFLFTVVSPDGTELQIPRYEKLDGISTSGEIAVKPHQTYRRQLLFSEWFVFSTAGDYRINAKLINPMTNDKQKIIKDVAEFSFILQVTPKNLLKLEKTSAVLYERALATSDFEQKTLAANALGYIDDPIVIPFLEKLLKADKMIDNNVLNALERIGGESAAEVVRQALQANSAVKDLTEFERLRDQGAAADFMEATKRNSEFETAYRLKSSLKKIEKRNLEAKNRQ